MTELEDVVKQVVKDFIHNEQLFTALDVSNEVKKALPFSRHREVRDLVRDLFTSEMAPAGYARTPIEVSLEDGSKVDALLYHSLVDSWDLDNKYDAQKRSQVSAKNPVVNVTAVGSPTVNPSGVVVQPVTVVSPVVVPAKATSPRELWDQLFSSQPSLFPRP